MFNLNWGGGDHKKTKPLKFCMSKHKTCCCFWSVNLMKVLKRLPQRKKKANNQALIIISFPSQRLCVCVLTSPSQFSGMTEYDSNKPLADYQPVSPQLLLTLSPEPSLALLGGGECRGPRVLTEKVALKPQSQPRSHKCTCTLGHPFPLQVHTQSGPDSQGNLQLFPVSTHRLSLVIKTVLMFHMYANQS